MVDLAVFEPLVRSFAHRTRRQSAESLEDLLQMARLKILEALPPGLAITRADQFKLVKTVLKHHSMNIIAQERRRSRIAPMVNYVEGSDVERLTTKAAGASAALMAAARADHEDGIAEEDLTRLVSDWSKSQDAEVRTIIAELLDPSPILQAIWRAKVEATGVNFRKAYDLRTGMSRMALVELLGVPEGKWFRARISLKAYLEARGYRIDV